MADITYEHFKSKRRMMEEAENLMGACDQTEDDLCAARKLLGLCIAWLPHGLLRDTVRQVSEGRGAAEAWQALEEMGASNG